MSRPCGQTAVSDGWLNCTLRVDVGTWYLPHGISLRTRLYNGLPPGVPILVAPGDRVRIRLENALGANTPSPLDSGWTGFRKANTTNLHIHGIYDDAIHDDTLSPVEPGDVKLYSYDIHPQAGSSLLWYHPHADGSSTMQIIGGMAGPFIITDPAQEAGFGFAARRRPLLLQSLHFEAKSSDLLTKVMDNGGASALPLQLANPSGYEGMLLLVNGGEAPRESIGAGSWIRLQLINAMVDSTNGIVLGFADAKSRDACTIRALAYDGVFLRHSRTVPSLMLASAARAEIAVSCSERGAHLLGSLGPVVHGSAAHGSAVTPAATLGGVVQAGLAVVHLDVGRGGGAEEGPRELPGPPAYLDDLMDVRAQGTFTATFGTFDGDNVINERTYARKVAYHMPLGSVQQWKVVGGEALGTEKLHPYHQHMTHFQIVSSSLPATAALLDVRAGDWRDTVPLWGGLNYTVRFRAPFLGEMMVHCHTLKHAEMGMMTLALIEPPPPMMAMATAQVTDALVAPAFAHAADASWRASVLIPLRASVACLLLFASLMAVRRRSCAAKLPWRRDYSQAATAEADEWPCCSYQAYSGH